MCLAILAIRITYYNDQLCGLTTDISVAGQLGPARSYVKSGYQAHFHATPHTFPHSVIAEAG